MAEEKARRNAMGWYLAGMLFLPIFPLVLVMSLITDDGDNRVGEMLGGAFVGVVIVGVAAVFFLGIQGG